MDPYFLISIAILVIVAFFGILLLTIVFMKLRRQVNENQVQRRREILEPRILEYSRAKETSVHEYLAGIRVAGDEEPLRRILMDHIRALRGSVRERLVRAGALPAGTLFKAYRSGKPAASGGVWDHAAAVQALDRAFAIGKVPQIAEALHQADEVLSQSGLRHALAQTYAVQIAALPPGQLTARDREEFAGLLLLAGRSEAALAMLPVNNKLGLRVLVALASGSDVYPESRALSALELAIAQGMTAAEPPSSDASLAMAHLGRGQRGAALMIAIRLLAPGVEVDPGDLAAGLWILRQAGRPALARKVALETLLLLPLA